MTNIEAVGNIYSAFGRGDITAILDHLAEDVSWDVWDPTSPVQELVPYLGARNGRTKVAEFFASLDELEFHDFTPMNLLAGDNQVVATIRVDLTVRSTGARFQDLELHLWTFDPDGKVSGLRHVIDTHKHVESRPPSAGEPVSTPHGAEHGDA